MKNIAIIAYNLKSGGLSSLTITILKLLNSIDNIKTKLIVLEDNCSNENNLDIQYFNLNSKNSILSKSKKYLQLKKYLEQDNFDYIIDYRYRINLLSEIFITKYLYPKTKIIYNVHSSKIATYLPNNRFFTHFLYGKSYKVICGSMANEVLVLNKHNLKNTLTVYNPIDIFDIESKSIENNILNFEYIIAVGRVEEIKQFDKLIDSYSKSNLISQNIKLVIVGNGSKLQECKNLTTKLGIENYVVFIGHSNNPYKFMKQAKFLVLCSKYEGFGLVLAESLACETPVISFDLATGPNEIIIQNENGLLVENQNFEKLTAAINEMISNQNLYKNCKLNSKSSIQKFSIENIRKDWIKLLN